MRVCRTRAGFQEAATVGLLTDLELASVQIALGQIDRLSASAFLSVNVSPQAINSRQLHQTLVGSSSDRHRGRALRAGAGMDRG